MLFSLGRVRYYSKILCHTAMRDPLNLLQIVGIYGMIRCLFTVIGFPLGDISRLTCTKTTKRQLHEKGETIKETIKKHRIHSVEKKSTEQEKEYKKTIKN